eukprot:TRINITY_DN1057_c0_g1_i3.p1 TRINITY_DN1057_c0_g1~~TRINITY_DN1057_c0_g1_i3.p1  ORF type:complete len:201 (-),score=40.13 TRINITY_DN1057_c0_g1_i3:214-816(-)
MLQQQHSGTSLIIGRTSTGLSAVAQSYSQIISTCPRCTSSPLDAFAAPHSLTLRLRPPSMLRALAGKGGKNRRRGKNDGEETKRELEYKEFGQEYAQVVRMLGNGRCECYCYDGVTRLGHIRGKMRKKVWVSAGDIVLCGLREYQDDKVDIIHRYNADEARNLKQYGELPEHARINETAVDIAMDDGGDADDIGIDFDDI